MSAPFLSATRVLDPGLVKLLGELQPGQRIRITQTVRVGQHQWPAVIDGVYRHTNHLATGLSTERVIADDILVVAVHFTKDNGELSSVTLDEQSKIELLR